MGPCLDNLRRLALAEVEATLESLPPPLRERARGLPVTFERRPNRALQADGFAPDTLGMFVGPEFAEEDVVPMPPQIILVPAKPVGIRRRRRSGFLRRSPHTTYLHELGHYLSV